MKNTNLFLRRMKLLPVKLGEYPFFIFVTLLIPLTYWFEVWVVLPYLFNTFSFMYIFLFVISHFILHNVIGNFMGILFCDTSIKGRIMPTENVPGVQFCSVCETLTPPRSYHCPACNICILKRDHHCIYTGCCIGHYNHRFFIMFIFYIFVATLISLPFNLYFLWDVISSTWTIIPRFLFPITLLIWDFNGSLEIGHFYTLIATLSIGGLAFCTSWFLFHIKLILEGKVLHERRYSINIYDIGKKNNIIMVFGERWHLAWVSPFLISALPCDGITFPTNEGVGQKDGKLTKAE